MGWKNVRDHYRIGHIVQVVPEKGICIGSPYVHDIIVIGFDGTLKKRDGWSNADLSRYLAEFDADPELLKRLVVTPDTFSTSITVYTYDGGNILEKQCEAIGWPNVTHDGLMMFANMFSVDRSNAIQRAKEDANAGVRIFEKRVYEAKEKLAELEKRLSKEKENLAKLEAMS